LPASTSFFLQIKQAVPSVHERFVGDSPYSNHGQRMINGQRMIQSATDMFVGWTTNGGHDFYVRQRRDGKVVPKGRDHHRPVGEVRGRMRASAGPHTRAAVTPPRWNYYLGASAKVEQAFAGFASGLRRLNETTRSSSGQSSSARSRVRSAGPSAGSYRPARSRYGSLSALVIGKKLSHVDEPVLTPCHESPKPKDKRQRAQGGPPPRRRGQQFIDELLPRRPINHGW
jgi:Uncharacterized protein conserved in bacteria (DUF2252)